MSRIKIDEIKAAIEGLSKDEYVQLRRWFSEVDWERWNKRIELDSESGKLDFLIKEALGEKGKGRLKEI